ncbi:MAG: excinuclease ABC subunit UvrC [Clostridia bacterium]|nr:excinuclease ABC subunit UvrC [Clostridia bacterium]
MDKALTKEKLLEKANSLPLSPGVYIMKDRSGKIIYVGKSRKLKNRVSQYFQNSEKAIKTEKMVSSVADFEYIVCTTEIEALSLENNLIKEYTPRYNIRLKDAKTYPYIKVTPGPYPRLVFTRRRDSDRGRYFGPFTGTATVFSILGVLQKSLGIPNCDNRFPEGIGKVKPCLYYQLGQCCGVCTGKVSEEEYAQKIAMAMDVLSGHTSAVTRMLEDQMRNYARNEQFEAAASCRDAIRALDSLHQTQQVVSSPEDEQDIVAVRSDPIGTCIYLFFVREGRVNNHVSYVFGPDAQADASDLVPFLCDFYRQKAYIPPRVMLSFQADDEDRELLGSYLGTIAGRKVEICVPERGHHHKLCQMAIANADEELRQYRLKNERSENTLARLAGLLHLEVYPSRIEAYDISNLGKEQITAGMVVCQDGRMQKSDYRTFRIRQVTETPDDYASMREALGRRLDHLSDGKGSFSNLPDLILLDGGRTHVRAVRDVMKEKGLSIPVFGMVKDDFHKTRALCTDEDEISIALETDVFTFIYKIQEEVHRYSVGRMEQGKRKTLVHSSLEKIPGIGPAKAAALLRHFGRLADLKKAPAGEIRKVKGLSEADARAVAAYFGHTEDSHA